MGVAMLLNSEAEVVEIVREMEIFRSTYLKSYHSMNTTALIGQLKSSLQDMRKTIANNLLNQFKWVGGIALQLMMSEKQSMDVEAFARFLMDKHRKYGAEPIIESGAFGIILRLSTKIARFSNMQELKNEPINQVETAKDEEDTLSDILGYCVLGYKYEANWVV